MGMILRIASSRIVGQGDIVGRSGYFSLNLSANSVMRGRLDARMTLKSLVADLRMVFFTFHESTCKYKKNAIHSTMYCIFICLTTYYTEIWNPHLSDMLKVVPETVSIKNKPSKVLDFQGL